MSATVPETSVIVAIGAVVTSLIGWITFGWLWSDRNVRTSDRITRAQTTADSALQEAAEAQNDVADLRESDIKKLHEALDQMVRDNHEQSERTLRETGESNAAIRTKITEVEFYIRDKSMLKTDFKDAMDDMKAVFSAAMNETKAVQLRMDTKLDNIAKDIHDGHGRR